MIESKDYDDFGVQVFQEINLSVFLASYLEYFSEKFDNSSNRKVEKIENNSWS